MNLERGEGHSTVAGMPAKPMLVWTPLWFLRWIPLIGIFLGHMGFRDSKGLYHEFVGPFFINNSSKFLFGDAQRYLILNGSVTSIETAILEADSVYSRRMHNILCDNCHHHSACGVSNMCKSGKSVIVEGNGKSTLSGTVSALRLFWEMTIHGKFVNCCAVFKFFFFPLILNAVYGYLIYLAIKSKMAHASTPGL